MPVIAFDLDGTLFDFKGQEIDNRQQMKELTFPIEESCKHVRNISPLYEIAYITGRIETNRDLTTESIKNAHLPLGILVMQPRWDGYEQMSYYKADAIRKVNAYIYVGDHEADKKAAELASVKFIHADEWKKYGLFFDRLNGMNLL